MVDTLNVLHTSRMQSVEMYPRLPRGRALSAMSGPNAHSYVWNGKFWFCNVCFLRTSSPSSLSSSRRHCIGFSPFDRFRLDSRGHTLWLAFASQEEGHPIICCSKCWFYGSVFVKGLNSPCEGGPTVGSSTKFYLSRGLHPISHLPFSKPVALHG